MSTHVPTQAPATSRIPRPAGTPETADPAGGTDSSPGDPPRTGTAATNGTSGFRFAVVVLASMVLSVAASTTVVALTGPDGGTSAPAAVTEPDGGAVDPGAVEGDAGRVIEDLGSVRDDSFCPRSSYPPVAC